MRGRDVSKAPYVGCVVFQEGIRRGRAAILATDFWALFGFYAFCVAASCLIAYFLRYLALIGCRCRRKKAAPCRRPTSVIRGANLAAPAFATDGSRTGKAIRGAILAPADVNAPMAFSPASGTAANVCRRRLAIRPAAAIRPCKGVAPILEEPRLCGEASRLAPPSNAAAASFPSSL